jgi:hypothetical protein
MVYRFLKILTILNHPVIQLSFSIIKLFKSFFLLLSNYKLHASVLKLVYPSWVTIERILTESNLFQWRVFKLSSAFSLISTTLSYKLVLLESMAYRPPESQSSMMPVEMQIPNAQPWDFHSDSLGFALRICDFVNSIDNHFLLFLHTVIFTKFL